MERRRGPMKERRILAVYLASVLMLSILVAYTGSEAEGKNGSFGGGNGTKSNPYQIEDVNDLIAMKNNLTANYILADDINTSAYNWASVQEIGTSSDPFKGRLDGNHKNITGLNLDSIDGQFRGLLGIIGKDGVVENLNLVEVDFNGYAFIGSIAGESWGKISNCTASGNVSASFQQSGGLVGFNIGSIMNCSFSGNVSSPRKAGGLVGRNGYNATSGSIVGNCSSSANVQGNLYEIGGIAGVNFAMIYNCSSTGFINSTGTRTGGLVGWNYLGNIRNCSSTGEVNGDITTGGLIGENQEGFVINCYSTGNVTGGENRIGGLIGSNYLGTVLNSHYNVDGIEINGINHLTTGGLFNDQYQDWFGNDLSLNISDYSTTLSPSGGFYEIRTIKGLEDLLGFADREEYSYRITADIDLADSPGFFIPFFNGVGVDGGNFTISNLTINISSDCSGFIGINNGGYIRNIRLSNGNITGISFVSPFTGYNSGNLSNCVVNADIEGKRDIGILCGYNTGEIFDCHAFGCSNATGWETGGLLGYNEGSVRNSSFSGTVRSTHSNVGGLIGYNVGGNISGCQAYADVEGDQHNAGIFIGWNENGRITNCTSRGNVSAAFDKVGGFIGYNQDQIVNCSAFATVQGFGYYTGGLVGHNVDSNISGSQFSGEVVAQKRYAGGLIGRNENGILIDCSTNTTVKGENYFGGLVGYCYYGDISNCSGTGDIIEQNPGSNSDYLGGLVGYNDHCKLERNHFFGNVSGENYAGGLFGYNNYCEMTGCSAKIKLVGRQYVGGLLGYNRYGSLSNCSADVSIDGWANVGGLVGLNYRGNIEDSQTSGYIESDTSAGGLIGGEDGKVNNCSSSCDMGGDGDNHGGLIGWNSGIVTNCYATGKIEGESYLGGLVGNNYDTLENCFATGDVEGEDWNYGGLVGLNDESASITNCFSVGDVDGWRYIGGFAGRNEGSISDCYSTGRSKGFKEIGGLVGINGGTISKSYSRGKVSGSYSSDVGGLVGSLKYGGQTSNSFWDTQTSSKTSSNGGTGKTTAQMKTNSTFKNSNWDFDDTWIMAENLTHPVFDWQKNIPHEADAGVNFMIEAGYSISLDGNGFCKDVGIINWTWSFKDGENVSLYGRNPLYRFNNKGNILVELNITDLWNRTSTDIVNVTVVDQSYPISDAGPDLTVRRGELIILNGSGSSDNVGIMNWTWTFDDVVPVTLYGEFSDYYFNNTGVFTVTLKVTDFSGYSRNDTVNITVLESTPPIANAGMDMTVNEDEILTFDGSGSSDNVGIVNWTWTFEDGFPVTLSGEKPTYTFSQPGIYQVLLNVSDAAGNWDNDTMNVTVLDVTSPVADAGPDQTINEDNMVFFNGSSSSDNVDLKNWTWTFTDDVPVILYGKTPSYLFEEPGVFTVILNVSDLSGNWDSDTAIITVLDITNPFADAGFDQMVDEDTTVQFDGRASSDNVEVVNWTWTFSDGGPVHLYGENPTYIFNEPGIFNVTLTVKDNAGNDDDDFLIITVYDVTDPVADAGPDQIVDEDTTVQFNGSGSSDNVDVVNWTWTFSDGGSVSMYGENPTHIFLEPGIYNVTLNATDDAGNWHEDFVIITVLDTTNPVADAGPDQNVNEDTVVHFDGSDSSDNVGIVNWTWTFSDGGPVLLYGESPTHVFSEPGTYNVTLNATDAAGNGNEDLVIIYVADVTDPAADAGPDQIVDEDTMVQFDGSGSSDNVGVVNWTWTFSDGGPVSLYGEDPVHVFPEPGLYEITLEIIDAAGNGHQDTVLITVLDVTDPESVAGPDQIVDEDSVVQFDGSGSSDNVGVVNWTWTFSDGGPVSLHDEYPVHVFPEPGIYNVTLNVTDEAGNWNMDSMIVTVLDVTSPSADAGPDQIVDEDSIVFFDGSGSSDNVEIVNWTWTMDGEDLLHGPDPSYIFNEPGTYTLILNTTDGAGNWNADMIVITVLDVTDPVADAGIDLVVDEDASFSLNGTGSSDNVGIVNWTWMIDEDTRLYGSEPDHIFLEPGYYTIVLTVTDAAGNARSDSVNISVLDITDPVAVAGEDQSIDEGTTLAFDGSESSDNVGVVNWTWTVNDDILLYGDDPEYEFAKLGTFNIVLTVTDAAGNWHTDFMNVTVLDITSPEAIPGEDLEVAIGATVVFNGSSSTDNGIISIFTWAFTYSGSDVILEGEEVEYTFEDAGTFEITLTVIDGNGNEGYESINLTVIEIGTVKGIVLDRSGNPVEGAFVEITGSDGQTRSATTDTDGSFSIEVVRGEFVWNITKDGFETISGTSAVDPMAEIDLDLSNTPLEKRSEEGSSIIIFVVIGILSILIIALVLFFVLRKKKGPGDESGPEGAEDETESVGTDLQLENTV
jgi:PKD repeat protein